jgi:hypothetical protein
MNNKCVILFSKRFIHDSVTCTPNSESQQDAQAQAELIFLVCKAQKILPSCSKYL